ncbi:MAG TPA: hypothetical protein VHB20_15250 [Verrucomicrobiae bacterium]|jgi:hypothetical protein|nr:hypothetical protein [Verrucomicrobiae bacterium]
MKIIVSLLPAVALAVSAPGAIFTNTPDADSFVRAAAASANYGGAGSLSVSGAAATNVLGTVNGVADTFIRFNTAAMVAYFNSQYGVNNWVIDGAALAVTEVGSPNNNIFTRGVGKFEVRWLGGTNADNWAEGSGMPMSPGSSGLAYRDEATLLNAAADESLGTSTNRGKDGLDTFTLTRPAGFVTDARNGGEVTLYLTAIDSNLGFTFNSRSFSAIAQPQLVISAVPQPGIASVQAAGANLILTGTNGFDGGVYIVLESADLATPLNQWTPLSTNVGSAAPFSITLTNALHGADGGAEFFLLATP